MNFNINNLRFVYFTNENNIPLLKLTLSNFFKYNNLENIKVSVISNNYTDDILPYSDVVQYLNGNTPFNGQGNHFSNSLKNTLSKIKEEYIFLLLDDYHFIDDTKFSDLQKLMEFIVAEDVDYFGFDDVAANLNADGWSPYDEKCCRMKMKITHLEKSLFITETTIIDIYSVYNQRFGSENHSWHCVIDGSLVCMVWMKLYHKLSKKIS